MSYLTKIFFSLLLVIFLYQSIVHSDINNSLLLHYTLNGNAHDSGSLNQNGIENGVITYEDGKFQQSIYLDGVEDFIDCGTIDITDSNLTVSIWFKSQSDKYAQTIIGNYVQCSYNNKGFYIMQYNTSKPYIRVGMGRANIEHDGVYFDNQWHHFVVVSNQEMNKTTLYIDGEKISEDTGCFANSKSRLLIGKGDKTTPNCGSGDNFDGVKGYVDDVRIYGKPLSTQEVQSLFNLSDCVFSDSDDDGVIDQWDRCPNTPIGLYTNKYGCHKDNNNFAISGQIIIKDQPINNGTAMLIQSGELHQNSSLDNGFFGFSNVNEEKPFSVIIRKKDN